MLVHISALVVPEEMQMNAVSTETLLSTLGDIHSITCPCLSQLQMAMNAMNSVTHGLTAGVQMTHIVMVASISVTRDSVCRTAQLWCSQWTAGLYTHINET